MNVLESATGGEPLLNALPEAKGKKSVG